MSWLIIPAIVALMLKVFMLSKQFKLPWVGQTWVGLVTALAGLNLSEVLVYSTHIRGDYSDYILRSYFVFATISLTYCYAYIANQTKYPFQRLVLHTHSVITVLLVSLFLFSPSMISGYTDDGLHVHAIKGDSYWLFQLFSMISIIISIATLVWNYKKEACKSVKLAYAYTMLGLAPISSCILVITTLMPLGYNVNASGIIPLATTAFLIISSKGKKNHLLEADSKQLLPNTKEDELRRTFSHVRNQSASGTISLKDATDTIELEIIRYTLHKNNGNMTLTARSLSMSQSTLYSRLKTHTSKIDNDEF